MIQSCSGTPSSKPINMPLTRRRRPLMKLSSSPITTVDAEGTAYLCFPQDHSWFQGTISTDDESNYSLYGERVTVTPEQKAAAAAAVAEKISKLALTESDEENNNADDDTNNGNGDLPIRDEDLPLSDYYRVTMIDHFSGQKHILPRIFAQKMDDSNPTTAAAPGTLFNSKHGEVTFEVETVYKGQKADIMIQRYVGSPSLMASKCLLYSGKINILFNDILETGRSWSL